jgi:uncharacterized delta-60 repeat protein
MLLTLLPGNFDPTFSSNGRQTVDFGYQDVGRAVVVQPDGKIVVVGDWGELNMDFGLVRLNADGTLDKSFNKTDTPTSYNGNGKLDIAFGPPPFGHLLERGTSVALQPDGKIIAAGWFDFVLGNDLAVARVNPNGTLDTSFSGDGKQTIDVGWIDELTAIVVQPDGKIILAGHTRNYLGSPHAVLVRLNTNGSLDPSFSGDGILTFSVGDNSSGYAIALQADGKIVMAGETHCLMCDSDFAVARLNPNGSFDTAFSGDGKQIIDFGYHDMATAVALQPDGKIVVAGFSGSSNPDFVLARLNANGTLDTSFNKTDKPTTYNGNGKLDITFGAPPFGGPERATAVAIQPGGKIVVAGYTDAGGSSSNLNNFAVARINPNGTLDRSFAGTGKQTVDFGGDDQANGLALQPGGEIVLAGFTTATGVGARDFAIARITGSNVHFIAMGGEPGRVEVFGRNGTTLGTFLPFGSGYVGGVSVALGDVNSDGFDDLITGATIGNPNVKIYSGAAFESGAFFNNPESYLLAAGFPYALNFNVGVNVAAGDVNGDGMADIITGAVPGNPHVRVFDGKTVISTKVIPTGLLAEGFAYGVSFNIGANVAAGDVNGDGMADIITGPSAGNPHTKVFNAAAVLSSGLIPTNSTSSLLAEYFPYAVNFNVGAFVTAGDYNRDGFADVITGASVGNPEVRVYSGKDMTKGTFNQTKSLLDFYFAFEPGQNIGIAVAASDFTGDGRVDTLVGTRSGAPRRRVFQNNLPEPASVVSGFDVADSNFIGALYVAA